MLKPYQDLGAQRKKYDQGHCFQIGDSNDFDDENKIFHSSLRLKKYDCFKR